MGKGLFKKKHKKSKDHDKWVKEKEQQTVAKAAEVAMDERDDELDFIEAMEEEHRETRTRKMELDDGVPQMPRIKVKAAPLKHTARLRKVIWSLSLVLFIRSTLLFVSMISFRQRKRNARLRQTNACLRNRTRRIQDSKRRKNFYCKPTSLTGAEKMTRQIKLLLVIVVSP